RDTVRAKPSAERFGLSAGQWDEAADVDPAAGDRSPGRKIDALSTDVRRGKRQLICHCLRCCFNDVNAAGIDAKIAPKRSAKLNRPAISDQRISLILSPSHRLLTFETAKPGGQRDQ